MGTEGAGYQITSLTARRYQKPEIMTVVARPGLVEVRSPECQNDGIAKMRRT
jgi:hypothetical protein